MRRKDREIVESEKIEKVIADTQILHVGFYDDGEIYIVPVNFGYVKQEENYVFYFHGAKAGRKYELSKTSPKVGFELDSKYSVMEADSACNFSAAYRSVIGTAKLQLVEETEEKIVGLNAIMRQTTGREHWEYQENMLRAVAVFRLDVEKLTCKAH